MSRAFWQLPTEGEPAEEATTKNTKNTKNFFGGNSLRGYALDRQGVFKPRKTGGRFVEWNESRCYFVFFVFFVVASFAVTHSARGRFLCSDALRPWSLPFRWSTTTVAAW